MKIFLLSTAIAATLLFAGPAFAKTPDGFPPSEEDICDAFSGAAFGLCNAYCEAMDCDSENPHASERACNKVLENFYKHYEFNMPPCLGEEPEPL